jgi:hypothetical protein
MEKIRLAVIVFVIVIVALALLRAPDGVFDFAEQLFASMFVGLVLTIVAAAIVTAFVGDSFNFPLVSIYGITISAFAVATFLLKLFLFN